MSITYEFHIDWNATDWLATPDFSEGIDDISSYVLGKFLIDRGKKEELGNIPAGILIFTVDNSDGRFSPPNAGSPLFGLMRPWLPIRVQAIVNGGGAIPIYTGFLSKITVNPHIDVRTTTFYCTDGEDLLARNMVALAHSERDFVSDGEAVGLLLTGAGWPASKRNLDVDTKSIVLYPRAAEY